MTQMTMGGAGANKVSGVLEEASCRRSEALANKKGGRHFLVDLFSVKCAIQGGRMAFLSDLKKAQKDIERQKCFRIVSGKY